MENSDNLEARAHPAKTVFGFIGGLAGIWIGASYGPELLESAEATKDYFRNDSFSTAVVSIYLGKTLIEQIGQGFGRVVDYGLNQFLGEYRHLNFEERLALNENQNP
jgi:hypothetical protein